MTATSNAITDSTWAAILTKLEHIRALRDRASTQAEAEAAAAALTKLLTKHDLSMAEFEQRATKDDGASTAHKPIDNIFDLGSALSWKRSLLNVLALSNGCRVVSIVGTTTAHIIGPVRNIEIVKTMYRDFEQIAVDSAARSLYYSKDIEHIKRTIGTKRWKTSYLLGFSTGLHEAMQAAKKQAVSETPGGGALVLVNERALERAVHEFVGGTRSMGRPRVDSSAYAAGKRDGAASVNGAPKRIAG